MGREDAALIARRAFIADALARFQQHPMDFDQIARELLREPEAKHHRLRSHAKIDLEDVEVFSKLLRQEFPGPVYFFANYKAGRPTPSKFSENHSITLYDDLLQAAKASLEVERVRPPFDGPDFNRPNIYCRWPWPDELNSGDPARIIGGRNEASDVFGLALQYRDDGRWFSFRYRCNRCIDSRDPKAPFRMSVLDRSKVPPERYHEIPVLTGQEGEFFAVYDLNDPETTAFAKRVHALWLRIPTKSIASFNPITGGIVESAGHDSKHWRSIGKRALEEALKTPPRYADFASQPSGGLLGIMSIISKSEGPALMIGPRPKKLKVPKAAKKAD